MAQYIQITYYHQEGEQGEDDEIFHRRSVSLSVVLILRLAENERLMGDIRRFRNAAQQSSTWADRVEATKIGGAIDSADRMKNSRSYVAAQSAKMQQRRKNLERRQQNAIEEKSGLLKNIERNDALLIHPLSYRKEVVAGTGACRLLWGRARI